ncbi:MAG: hypothetical protein ACRDRK_18785 [Pseudonocardia sp.]
MTTRTTTPGTVGRFVDPDDLICQRCREHAVELSTAGRGERSGFVHRDGSALCGTQSGRTVEPVEVTR